MTVSVNACGKLNLYLDITGTAPNGYHYLENITQSVDIYDTVTVTAKENKDDFCCNISCTDSRIPCDSHNTAYKAARVFSEYAGSKAGMSALSVDIKIEKRLPLMGGMGGSSVDGAAVLAGLNGIFGNMFTESEICELGYKIGADVPICLMGGTLSTTGVGNMPVRLSRKADNCSFLCVQPGFLLDTTKAYRLYDNSPLAAFGKVENITAEIKNNGILSCGDFVYNIFTRLYQNPEIEQIKARLISLGAEYSEMTGSGSVVYGVFYSAEAALSALQQLNLPEFSAFCCNPTDYGVKLLQ